MLGAGLLRSVGYGGSGVSYCLSDSNWRSAVLVGLFFYL